MIEPGEELRERPEEWTARLGRALREEGLDSSLVESLAALEALPALDLTDPTDVYLGLRTVFISDPRDAAAFDRVFWALWEGRERGTADGADAVEVARRLRRTTGAPPERRRGAPIPPPPGAAARDPRASAGDRAGGESGDPGRRAGAAGERPVGAAAESGEADTDEPSRAGLAWSPGERLARRSFASLEAHEVRELDRAFDRLMVKLSTRRSRRLEPGGRRGRVDVRRSLREALRHDGELIRLARRRRRVERPRVVLLCDVSGSMERYSRFLVRFLLAARRERTVETFAFSTRLTRLTPYLWRARVDEALAALGQEVPGWSGGTRIGESLETFVERHGRSLLGQRTVVIILSDGLDQGETEPLERAMESIRRRARKVIWLNPLLESPRYRPEARGMKAALPYVHEFASGHSLEALRRVTALIRI